MKVILQEDVKNVGNVGDVVNVADGYGRNWIHVFGPDLKYRSSFGGRGSEPGQFVTCHGMARVGPSVSGATRYPPTYTNPRIFQIPLQFDNPIWFGGTTKTDFSWAVGGSL